MSLKNQSTGFWSALLAAVISPFIIKALEGTAERLPVGLKWAGDGATWLWEQFGVPVPLGGLLIVALLTVFLSLHGIKMTLDYTKQFRQDEEKIKQLEQTKLTMKDVIASKEKTEASKDARISALEDELKSAQGVINEFIEKEKSDQQNKLKLTKDELVVMDILIHGEIPVDLQDLIAHSSLHRVRLDHAITSLKDRHFIKDVRPGGRSSIYFSLLPAGTAYAVDHGLIDLCA